MLIKLNKAYVIAHNYYFALRIFNLHFLQFPSILCTITNHRQCAEYVF